MLDPDGCVPGDDSTAATSADLSTVRRQTRSKRFRHWRRTRPFWGGLIMMLGGAEILLTVWVGLPVMLHVGLQNSLGYLIPVVIALAGLLVILNPGQRVFITVVTAVLGLATWLTSNLGGFVLGMSLTLIGCAMAFAWRPRIIGPAPSVEPREAEAPSGD